MPNPERTLNPVSPNRQKATKTSPKEPCACPRKRRRCLSRRSCRFERVEGFIGFVEGFIWFRFICRFRVHGDCGGSHFQAGASQILVQKADSVQVRIATLKVSESQGTPFQSWAGSGFSEDWKPQAGSGPLKQYLPRM